MVHTLQALYETWRVLVPNGIMCNIHPPGPLMPFDVVAGADRITAGFLDATDRPSDSTGRVRIAEGALAILAHEGRFMLEKQEEFYTYWYWDTLADAEDYYTTVSELDLTDTVRERAVKILEDAGEGARVSIQRLLYIARFRKVLPLQ